MIQNRVTLEAGIALDLCGVAENHANTIICFMC